MTFPATAPTDDRTVSAIGVRVGDGVRFMGSVSVGDRVRVGDGVRFKGQLAIACVRRISGDSGRGRGVRGRLLS